MGKKRKSSKPIPPLRGFGFRDADAAKEVLRKRANAQVLDPGALLSPTAVRQVLIRRKLLALANFFEGADHPPKLKRDSGRIIRASNLLLARDFKGVVANRAIERICRNDVCQDELLECVDAVLQFLELVIRDFGHGSESSSVACPAEPTPSGTPSHRLSETQE